MKPRKFCVGLPAVPPVQLTPPPLSQPASTVSENAPLSYVDFGASKYFTSMLLSVWTRQRSGMPSQSWP